MLVMMAFICGNVRVFFSLLFILCPICTMCDNHSAKALPDTCGVKTFADVNEVDILCTGPMPDFSKIDFPHAPYVYEYTLVDCTFDRVPKNAFQGLVGLHNLYIYCNKLVPEVHFEGNPLLDLQQLKMIAMEGNNIKTLPSNIFCNLPSLEKLYLGRNSFTSTEILGFGSSSCLPTDCPNIIILLKVSENKITHLPRHTFCTLTKLVVLDVSNTALTSIDEDALLGLDALKMLDLSHNNLTTIPENTLRTLTGLFSLDLASNPHLNISRGFLKPLSHLKGLFLPNTGLERLEKDVFNGLDKLESLMLYYNRLQTIDEEVFEPLIGVPDSDVDPEDCEEDAIDRLVFGGGIIALNDEQAKLLNVTGVRYLNLDKNIFTAMPPIKKLVKLQVFSIAKNQIENLQEDDFYNLRQLQRLTISHNRIESIAPGVFANLKCLRQLLLDYNSLQVINDTTFQGLVALTDLTMRSNRIKDINGLFVRNENLETLNLSRNYIEELSLKALPISIKRLDLSHNRIKMLHYTLDFLSKQTYMDVLDLSNNQIGIISKTFFPPILTQLYLHNNLIRNISDCIFCSLSKIKNVTLHNNLLRTVHPGELKINASPVFPKIPTVSLSGNNLSCDCQLHELRTFKPTQAYLKIDNFEALSCHREYSKGMPSMIRILQAMPPEDFLCRLTYLDNTGIPMACDVYHDFHWNYVIVDCSCANLTVIPSAKIPQVRKLYLDGNDFSTVYNTTFNNSMYQNLTAIFLNISNVQIIQDNSFVGLVNLLYLHLENNGLKYLSNKTFSGLGQLLELHLSFNLLMVAEIKSFDPLLRLRYLLLNDNQLISFPIWELENLKYLSTISLSENPWSCDCDYVQHYREWLQDYASAVVDINSLFCKFEDNSISEVPMIAFNTTHCFVPTEANFLESRHFPLLVGLLTSLVIFAVASLVLFVYRREMQVLVYSRYGVRLFHKNNTSNLDQGKLYDGFLCYSNDDEDFVINEIVPKLEGIDPPFRLCIHQRDFLVGGYITDNILEAVSKSRRSLLILSEAFIKSEWCRFEFKTAYVQMLKDRCNHVIVIVLGNIPKQLDPEMRLYLKTNTYITWGDKLFWERLYFAMPDRATTREL